MTGSDPKADLRRYLQEGREALLWKLDGLSEYDIRRPLVPTGTNLLGLIKHQAGAELAYFGDTFGRPCPQDQLPWDEADPMSDMWATPAESREFLTGRYRRAWAHPDATIDALALDAIGHVPWWPPDQNEVTLHHILVRIATDTGRHAGHADIIRELIDGTAGRTRENTNLPPGDQGSRQAHRDQVERAAREATAGSNIFSALGPGGENEVVRRGQSVGGRRPLAPGGQVLFIHGDRLGVTLSRFDDERLFSRPSLGLRPRKPK